MSDADRSVVVWRMAAQLARARSEGEVTAAVARAAGLLSGAGSARVWMFDRSRGYRFSGAWPEEADRPERPPDQVIRAVVSGAPVIGAAEDPFRSRLAVPLLTRHRPLGAVELLEAQRPAGAFTADVSDGLTDLLRAADSALQSILQRDSREMGQLAAIARLTHLYDLGRSLARTLDMKELEGVIADRLHASLEVEGAYLWIPDDGGELLTLVAASGRTAEAVRGWKLRKGEGVAGRVMETGEATLIDEADEIPGREARPENEAGHRIGSVAAAPILSKGGKCLGIVEIVKNESGDALDSGDLAFLNEAAATGGLALENAGRLDAERRASNLGSLLRTAQELGSTLDVQEVTFALVHRAASVIRYKRAAVGLYRGTRLEVVAVSGQTFVDETLPEMKVLGNLLTWAAGLDEGLYVVQEEDGTIDADRPETREKFKTYFQKSGSRSLVAIPLKDDEDRLGIFTLEADAPYAFWGRDIEAASLLAVQATVAIRNATLYQQIPMVRVFEPLTRRKQKFLSLSWGRRLMRLGASVVLGAILVLVPVPLRVSGPARVLPERRHPVTVEVDGRVSQVLVREGEDVVKGQTLAVLDDADYQAGWDEARARYEMALREESRFRAGGKAASAAVEKARLNGLRAELELWETRLSRTHILSTAEGVVATPRLDEMAGARLTRGEVFCEVVDPADHRIEVEVPEREIGLLEAGQAVKVKLSAFPTRSFLATVERVGVAATEVDGERVFLVRARLGEVPVALRSGMTGKAKIHTGRASLGRVLFRRPARWLWRVAWGWLA